ncbi:MAG: hypothetical protein NTZ65_03865 [Candidatus Berkelbacteria bacterium]|nr:hypothetical protein [Candidatus Berkelbacteria bacterium]
MANRASKIYIAGLAAIVVSVLGVITLSTASSLVPKSSSNLLESICDGQKSFYLPSELLNLEKKKYSKNARGFKFIDNNYDSFRIVIDFGRASKDNNEIEFVLYLTNLSQEKVDLENLGIKLESSDKSQITLSPNDNNLELIKNQTKVFKAKQNLPKDDQESSMSYDLIVSNKNNNVCTGKIPEIVKIEPKNLDNFNVLQADNLAVSSREFGDFEIPPGFSPIGFSDFRQLKPFKDKGLTIIGYNLKGHEWTIISKNNDFLAEPGVGYFVLNPTEKTILVDAGFPFFTPDDIARNTVRKGWNLIYNDTGNNASPKEISISIYPGYNQSRDFEVSSYSLQDLIDKKIASGDIYIVDPGDASVLGRKTALSSSTFLIPQDGVFWFYLFDEPQNLELKVPNFQFELTGGGDTYKSGDFVPLTFKITNNDNKSHQLLLPGIKDPCFLGLTVLNSSNNVVYNDLENKTCPLWPSIVEVSQGAKEEYNYSWAIPKNLKGDFTLKAYFNYSRLNSSNMLYNESKIKVE